MEYLNTIFIVLIILIITLLMIKIFFDSYINISVNDHILSNSISKYLYSISTKKEDIHISYKNYLNLLEQNNNKYRSLILFDNFSKLLDLAYNNKLTITDIVLLMK